MAAYVAIFTRKCNRYGNSRYFTDPVQTRRMESHTERETVKQTDRVVSRKPLLPLPLKNQT